MPSTDADRIETLGDLRASISRLVERYSTVAFGDWDDEGAHATEDDIHLALLRQWLPADWMAEVERLSNMDFARWCA